jgi:abequosyltransferase
MENTKILTIGIPTYNGATALKKNIDNLISIIKSKDLMDIVNIFVSINASTDNSENICEEYKNIDFFSYLVQKENVGYDSNVNTVVENSITQYVWLLSDDDTVTQKGLVWILEIIKTDNPSYIFVNHKDSAINRNKKLGGGGDTIKIYYHTMITRNLLTMYNSKMD